MTVPTLAVVAYFLLAMTFCAAVAAPIVSLVWLLVAILL